MPTWTPFSGFFHWHHSRLAEQIAYLGEGEWLLPKHAVMTLETREHPVLWEGDSEWLLHYKGQEWDVATTEVEN